MSLTSYRAAPPRGGVVASRDIALAAAADDRSDRRPPRPSLGGRPPGRPGGDPLSRALRRSTTGAAGFHGRVRDGVGCGTRAMAAGPGGRPRGGVASVTLLVSGVCVRACLEPACVLVPSSLSCVVVVPRLVGRRCASSRPAPPCGVAPPAVRGAASPPGRGEPSRAIRTGRLRASPRLHPRPIDVVVSHGPRARPGLAVGFPLRCLQRLSRPDLATRLRGWRHDRPTRGPSAPVLSY